MDSNIPNSIDPYLSSDSNRSFDTNRSYERQSWKEMAQNLYTDVARLLEREGQLIRTEMNEKMTQAKAASIALVTSGVILFVGTLCLAATAIIVLDQFLPLWLAATIVTAVLLTIGAIMFAGAKKKLNADDLKPNKSIQAIGEIRHTLQEKVHEITKH
jgi:ABC-type anion transport system duplicated permease subunit